MFYIVIGIVLLLLSAGTIAVMVLFEIRDRRAVFPMQIFPDAAHWRRMQRCGCKSPILQHRECG